MSTSVMISVTDQPQLNAIVNKLLWFILTWLLRLLIILCVYFFSLHILFDTGRQTGLKRRSPQLFSAHPIQTEPGNFNNSIGFVIIYWSTKHAVIIFSRKYGIFNEYII